jgi:hypothetical protein
VADDFHTRCDDLTRVRGCWRCAQRGMEAGGGAPLGRGGEEHGEESDLGFTFSSLPNLPRALTLT